MYWPFEPERNVPVDCNSDESHTPGTFCVKIVKQGPRGFICKHAFYNSKKGRKIKRGIRDFYYKCLYLTFMFRGWEMASSDSKMRIRLRHWCNRCL